MSVLLIADRPSERSRSAALLGHWQSLWAEQLPNAVRVQQDDWFSPVRSAWVHSISQTILAQDGPVVLAAHSLGCIAVTHLPPEVTQRIAYARAWGSESVRLQSAGHVNVEAGFGTWWSLGLALLQSLLGASARMQDDALAAVRLQPTTVDINQFSY